jgi:predicted phage tail component-like protein
MIGNYEYDGTESTAYNLVCRSIERPLLPSARPKTVQIVGKSGIIDYSDGDDDYDTRPLTMHIAYVGDDYAELRRRAREIAAWLSPGKWAKLIVNDEPDKYYLAKITSKINLDTFRVSGEADIAFECQPFAYMVVSTGDDMTWDEADFPWETDIPWVMNEAYTFTATENTSFIFENPGTQEINNSSPEGTVFDVVITGSWTELSIALSGKSLTYPEAGTGVIKIDNINMEILLDDENILDVVEGDIESFLPVVPGQNTINIEGTGLDITVEIVFNPMWK